MDNIKNKYNKNSVNNVNNNKDTVLNLSVLNYDIPEIIQLINIGANVNGISNCGITHKIPATCIFINNKSFTENTLLIETLILNKLDVNSFDLWGNTLLTSYCENLKTINETTIDELIYLITKGCNVNGTIFKNPLYILSNKNNFKVYMNDIIILFKLYELQDIEFYEISANIMKPINLYKFFNNTLKININDVDVLNTSNNNLIEIIKLIYKVNDITNIKKLKDIIATHNLKECDLNFIKQYNDIIYNKVFNNPTNNTTLNYNELNEFTLKELIIYNENKITNIFHLSEIPSLLKLQINVYTTKPLNVEFLKTLLNKMYIPELTLSDLYLPTTTTTTPTNKNVNKKESETRRDSTGIFKNLNLFYFLKTLVNSFNIYINVDNLMYLNYNQLYETLLVLHMGNKNEMYKNINNIDLYNSKNNENKMFNILIKYLIREIQNNKLNLVSNVIDQVLNDVNTINEILKIFPQNYHKYIKEFITYNYNYNDSYENFLNYISNKCILLDKNLLIDMNKTEITANNKFYINEKLSDILNNRSKDSINNTWKDLINMLYASLL